MNPNYYAIIPANVRYDKSLTPNAKLLYGELTALSNQEGYCWASNSYFAELYSVSNTSISKWVSSLEDKGYIRTELRYKEGTKQISERRIYIIDNVTSVDTPIEEKLNTPLRKVKEGIEEKLNTPIEEKLKDNNTVYNNTINNTSNKSSPSSKKESKQTIPKEWRDKVLAEWNNITEDTKIAKVRAINHGTKRYSSLNARIKEYGLEEVLDAISEIGRSSFLQGENARGWSISFDWFIAPNNFLKVLEGTYRDKQAIPEELRGRVMEEWNRLAKDTKITKVEAITHDTERYTMLNARIKEYGLEVIIEAINEIRKSSFLQGENSRKWFINFDWFIAPNNFLKVIEGTYRDKEPTYQGNKLLSSQYRVSTEDDLARDGDGNLISF